MQYAILKKAALSVIICAAITGLIILSFLGEGGIALTQFMITYGLHFLLLFAGVGCLIVRILHVFIKVKWFSDFALKFTDPAKFHCVFLGIGNSWMGILAIVLHVTGRANLFMVETMLPNLIVGVIILADIIFSRRKTRFSSSKH
jgi:hypothetical protein